MVSPAFLRVIVWTGCCLSGSATGVGQATSPSAVPAPFTMTECEGVDNCATWTFLGAQGTGIWKTGEVASLFFQVVKKNVDGSYDVVIHRADSTGASAGLTAEYRGTMRNGRVGGEFTSSWGAHWATKTENWYALPQAPLTLPSRLHVCAGAHCFTYDLENGHFANYTNLPYQQNERRILEIRSFTRESICFYETDRGSYPLTASWNGKISKDGDEIADGQVQITSWAGKPTPNSKVESFRITWGRSLENIPGSDAEMASSQPNRQVSPQETFNNVMTGAEDALRFAKFLSDLENYMGQHNN